MLPLMLSSSFAAPTPVAEVGANGRYTNVIAQASPVTDYVEVCFVGGAELQDLHLGGGSTAGGSCVPGNVGFLLELTPRPSARWAAARGSCLADGMRLPELWEMGYAEVYATTLGFGAAGDVRGWATNRVFVDPTESLTSNGLEAPFYSGNGGINTVVFYDAFSTSSVSFLCAM